MIGYRQTEVPTPTEPKKLDQPYKLPRPIKGVFIYGLLGLMAGVILFPLFFSLSIALQGPTPTPQLLPRLSELDWNIFGDIFRREPNLLRWIINSFVVAITITFGVLVTSTLAGFALSGAGFGGQTVFLFICLGTLLIPFEATIVPNYLFITGLGWKDTYQGLIVPFLASGFGIFLVRQYFLTIPRELYEAAILDGCSRLRYLWAILIPLSRPALATLAVYSFLGSWNQYYWPLLVTDSPQWRTTQVGITIFRSSENQVFNAQMAANVVVMLPTLLILVIGQRQLVRGLTSGALKG